MTGKSKQPVIFGWENVYASAVSDGWVCYVHGQIPKTEAEWMWVPREINGPPTKTIRIVCGDCILEECEMSDAEATL